MTTGSPRLHLRAGAEGQRRAERRRHGQQGQVPPAVGGEHLGRHCSTPAALRATMRPQPSTTWLLVSRNRPSAATKLVPVASGSGRSPTGQVVAPFPAAAGGGLARGTSARPDRRPPAAACAAHRGRCRKHDEPSRPPGLPKSRSRPVCHARMVGRCGTVAAASTQNARRSHRLPPDAPRPQDHGTKRGVLP